MTTSAATNYCSATADATCGSVVVPIEEEKNTNATKTHKPGFKLTQEERMTKFDKHQFGLCVTCDAGLDDRADFTCDPRLPGGFALMCNACFEYYNKNGYVTCGYGPFSYKK
jgi:hypothetical protein